MKRIYVVPRQSFYKAAERLKTIKKYAFRQGVFFIKEVYSSKKEFVISFDYL